MELQVLHAWDPADIRKASQRWPEKKATGTDSTRTRKQFEVLANIEQENLLKKPSR